MRGRSLRAKSIARCLLVLVMAAVLGASGGGMALAGPSRSRKPEPAPSPERWGSFAAYPGARRLCQSHVTGAGEAAGHIDWALYATDRPPSEVRVFYAAHPGRAKPEPPAEVQVRIGQAILSAYPADNKTYPRCGVDPKATDRTAIVVSGMTAPAK